MLDTLRAYSLREITIDESKYYQKILCHIFRNVNTGANKDLCKFYVFKGLL